MVGVFNVLVGRSHACGARGRNVRHCRLEVAVEGSWEHLIDEEWPSTVLASR